MASLDKLFDKKARWEQLIRQTKDIKRDIIAIMLRCRREIAHQQTKDLSSYDEILESANNTLSEIDTSLPQYEAELSKIKALIEEIEPQTPDKPCSNGR